MQRSASCGPRQIALEERQWQEMAPVGREFGSPDFDRLMAEDQRLGRGVFDSSLLDAIADRASNQSLSTVFAIARRWGVDRSGQALLLGVDAADVEDLERARHWDALSDETKQRVHYLLAIADGLQDLLCVEERADAWVHQPNAAPMFRGTSALSYMLGGRLSDLSDVAAYLAAVRSGDFA